MKYNNKKALYADKRQTTNNWFGARIAGNVTDFVDNSDRETDTMVRQAVDWDNQVADSQYRLGVPARLYVLDFV